jgi:hypothetical protein
MEIQILANQCILNLHGQIRISNNHPRLFKAIEGLTQP